MTATSQQLHKSPSDTTISTAKPQTLSLLLQLDAAGILWLVNSTYKGERVRICLRHYMIIQRCKPSIIKAPCPATHPLPSALTGTLPNKTTLSWKWYGDHCAWGLRPGTSTSAFSFKMSFFHFHQQGKSLHHEKQPLQRQCSPQQPATAFDTLSSAQRYLASQSDLDFQTRVWPGLTQSVLP